MGHLLTNSVKFACAVLVLVFVCEYVVYYVFLFPCMWPKLDESHIDATLSPTKYEPVKAMLLADTHLFGSRNGYWFDKLRREWQMYRTFQTAMNIFKPDIVFVLGDLFDEGLWCSGEEFDYYVQRFQDLFYVPNGTQLFVTVGNRDIGFHNEIKPYLLERFNTAFNVTPVQLISIKGNHFVLINSMAMEGDGCSLCHSAEMELQRISRRLECSKGHKNCDSHLMLDNYSPPILLQHFPMYRESDAICHEPDEAPPEIKKRKFREKWDCLSRKSSRMLYDYINPRLIINGHTHHCCHIIHDRVTHHWIHEWTMPSFNWKNKDNPSFMLAVIAPNNYDVTQCYMPQESTVITIYYCGGVIIILWITLKYRRLCRRTQRLQNKI